MMKKLLCSGLALVMCVSALSVSALALGKADAAAKDPIDVDVTAFEEPCEAEAAVEAVPPDDADGPCDIEIDQGDAVVYNVNRSETITLAKGKSKTYSFNVSGGWFSPDHNAVSVVVDKVSGGNYQYISEDVTNSRELANKTYSVSTSHSLLNLVPGDTYEVTLVNLGTSDLVLNVSLTSYID